MAVADTERKMPLHNSKTFSERVLIFMTLFEKGWPLGFDDRTLVWGDGARL